MTSTAASTVRDTRRSLPLSDLGLGAVLAPIAVGAAFLGLWQWAVVGLDIDPYVVPSPGAIWDQLVAGRENVVDGMRVTGRNALIGLVIGALIGILGAVLASMSRVLDQMAVPIVAALSVIPIVALAPVLYTMFGAAVDTGRIVIASLAACIPVYLNTLRGLRQVTPVHRELMTAYAATPVQVARTVTLPTATPYLFTGLRIASSLSVISALIAEYFGGPVGGLGKSITSAAASSNYPLAWAYVVGAIVLGLAFYVVTLLIELWLSRHHPQS
jgi:NitT/TauT family transport system permease protein